jgi:prevent-host-death family protein
LYDKNQGHPHSLDNGQLVNMKTINASDFEAKCSQLMSEVAETGDVIIITRNGQPVAQLGPAIVRATTLSGLHKGKIDIIGDIVAPTGERWDAECSPS